MSEPVVLSIGTSHPWNVAGLGADLRVAGVFGIRGLTVVAGVSAQDARGVRAIGAVAPDLIEAQLASIPMEAVAAVRVGALVDRPSVAAVAAFLRANGAVPAVIDPVFAATFGGPLLDDAGIEAFRDELATLGNAVLTPNLEEARRLLGGPAIDREGIARAAEALRARGARGVLVKGGHLDGDPLDALATESGVQLFADERVEGAMRGTGCALAMSLACELARGLDLRDAVASARTYVRARIASHRQFGGIQVAY